MKTYDAKKDLEYINEQLFLYLYIVGSSTIKMKILHEYVFMALMKRTRIFVYM